MNEFMFDEVVNLLDINKYLCETDGYLLIHVDQSYSMETIEGMILCLSDSKGYKGPTITISNARYMNDIIYIKEGTEISHPIPSFEMKNFTDILFYPIKKTNSSNTSDTYFKRCKDLEELELKLPNIREKKKEYFISSDTGSKTSVNIQKVITNMAFEGLRQTLYNQIDESIDQFIKAHFEKE